MQSKTDATGYYFVCLTMGFMDIILNTLFHYGPEFVKYAFGEYEND
ncbi:MAG: hypothetical protein AABY49_09740 [Planctomycetota bacterium]